MPNIDDIVRYENGEMDEIEMLEFFSALIKTGTAWELQGSYGRTAHNLIQFGLLSESGDILVEL